MSSSLSSASSSSSGIHHEKFLHDGADQTLITEAELEPYLITSIVGKDEAGGISFFLGTTRDNFNGKKVLRLEYEAYIPMAMKQMGILCVKMREKWPSISRIAVLHRIGVVDVGKTSVLIAASAPHRADAIESVEWCINELKRTVAIWKKEWYEDGSIWKQNAEFDPSSFAQQQQKEQSGMGMGVESFPVPLAQEHPEHQNTQADTHQRHQHHAHKHECSCSNGTFIQEPTRQ